MTLSPYSPDMEACYWISGATDLFRDLSVRNPADIARLLTAALRNSRPIQDASNSVSLLTTRRPRHRLHFFSPVCLLNFALSTDEVYTKSPADLSSALARYIKPSTMDVSEHLTAHLVKEEDLIRRRNVNISAGDLHTAMYGSDDAAGKHTAGSVEDSIMMIGAMIARLLNSLRPSEPDHIEHLDRLILYIGGSTWTLTSLIDAPRL